MPRIELTPDQKAHAREVAEKAARIMEENSWRITSQGGEVAPMPPSDWWVYDAFTAGLVPRFSLDGTDPDDDAKACGRMKERLIEWGGEYGILDIRNSLWIHGPENPWHCELSSGANTRVLSFTAPLECLAVAQALIAVDEERRKQSTDKERTHE